MRARITATLTLALIAASGCGRIGFGLLDETSPDATPRDGASSDAGPLGPFPPPTLVASLSSPGRDEDPTLTADLLELYFVSDRAGGLGMRDVWVSTRTTITDAWGSPNLVTVLSTAGLETNPEISPDGLTLLYSSDRAGSIGARDMWMSTRASRSDSWSTPVEVAELSSISYEGGGATDETQLRCVFDSDRVGGMGGQDMYTSKRAAITDPWDPPVLVTELNSPQTDADGYFADNGLTMWFCSDRATGNGIRDIYTATRASLTEPFGSITAQVVFNSASDDRDPWLSPDQRYFVMVSDRGGTTDIYESRR